MKCKVIFVDANYFHFSLINFVKYISRLIDLKMISKGELLGSFVIVYMLHTDYAIFYTLADTQVHLCKHLLKTVCQDVVNLIFEMVATENLLTLADHESFTTEVATVVIGYC